ncbi:MAG: site-specific DNA-methyltransferase [Alphaproteobacteria bacterium]|nr:MAG: site-specific DNA-methyltransferase [Alphaproteobacteria bacterium]
MTKKQKLELTWVGKENRPRLEPRILIEDTEKSYHAVARVSENDIFDNILVHGDNLLALKALEADYAGKVKCVFIDPPYNTGSAFTHYDDGLEHSIWLGLMRDRLEVIRRLLSEDGSLWITIDDNEAHYLKVLCDEIFGRANFIANVIWQKIYTVKNSARFLSDMHDHVLVFAKSSDSWSRNLLPRSDELNASYTNPDNDPRGPWTTNAVQARNFYSLGSYEILSPSGVVFTPPPGTYWRVSEATFKDLDADGRVWWGRDGRSIPRIKRYLSEVKQGVVPATMWFHEEAGQNAQAKAEVRALTAAGDDVFLTPKPEKLIERVLQIATNPGDLVLDSFAGSGTTGAVAHKMGRRWVMVEIGDHATTHIVPRLKKVVDGEDQGGISKAFEWKGGGGFRYYELAPSLLQKDKWGREVISKEYDPAMLAQALCKLEGFTYAPSPDVYWQQGHSSESDFLYVTTQTLGPEELIALSEDVGEARSLLILCAAFRGNPELWPNLTVRKIPNHIRGRCEWGHDDYSLNVANLPLAEVKSEPAGSQASLFDEEHAA